MVKRGWDAIGGSMGLIALIIGSAVCFADTLNWASSAPGPHLRPIAQRFSSVSEARSSFASQSISSPKRRLSASQFCCLPPHAAFRACRTRTARSR